MKKVVKWKKNEDGKIVSIDGYVRVSKDGDQWKMIDLIDDVKEVHKTQKDALDAGAKQMMISELGQFNVFLEVVEKNGDLIFEHQTV